MTQLYIEDCLETLKRDIEYDYVVTSPPDFNELTGDSKTNFSYTDFLESFIKELNPKGNFASICISDRKSGGKVISKHSMVVDVFENARMRRVQVESKRGCLHSFVRLR